MDVSRRLRATIEQMLGQRPELAEVLMQFECFVEGTPSSVAGVLCGLVVQEVGGQAAKTAARRSSPDSTVRTFADFWKDQTVVLEVTSSQRWSHRPKLGRWTGRVKRINSKTITVKGLVHDDGISRIDQVRIPPSFLEPIG